MSVGVPIGLIEAASLGARIATRARLARGQDEETVRRQVIDRFRFEIECESYGEEADKALLAAVESAADWVLEARRAASLAQG